MRNNPVGRIIAAILASGVLLAILVGLFETFEWVGAGEIMVVQFPNGKLRFYSTPGYNAQWFGKVTKYKKRDQFWFSSKGEEGKAGGADESIKVRFNDGGHANLSGSMAWEMPIDDTHLGELHSKYGSQDAIEHQLIRTVVEKSVYMTGPLMSSAESYAAKRNDLLNYIEDQIRHGVYKTVSRDEEQRDAAGQKKTVKVVEIVKKGEVIERETESPINDFGLKVFNLSINEIKYDAIVETQIQAQQKQIMDIQTSIAKSKTAEQDAITAEQQGKANAAKAKWAKEVIKAEEIVDAEKQFAVQMLNAQREFTNAVILADQKFKVSELDLRSAENKKKTDIELGQGESERRKLVMEADGALEKKLDAWVNINKEYAQALSKYQGSFVPSVVMGGGGTGTGQSPMDLINLLMSKTALDLGVSLQTVKK